MKNQIKNVLKIVTSFLEMHNIGYAIIGGIANQVWGQARFTYDIDIKVLVPDSNYDFIRSLITEYFPNNGRPDLINSPLIISVNVENIIIDFLLSTPGYEELLIKRAIEYNIENLIIWICPPEDLIIQKAIAGRLKDWQDIEGILIEQFKKLDWNYLEDWLKQFSNILEEQEILEKYEEVLEKIRLNYK